MNIKNIAETIKHNEFHLDRYIKFVELCQSHNKVNNYDYMENHHILPKALFPEYADLRKHKWNKIRISARHHYIAHHILAKCFGGSMWFAVRMMQNYNIKKKNIHAHYVPKSSILYEMARKEAVKQITLSAKGRTTSQETRNKMSVAHINRERHTKICPHCKMVGSATQMTRYHFENCLDNPKNKDVVREKKQATCPHCKKTGFFISMGRWHFDNCKQNPDNIDGGKVIKASCIFCKTSTDLPNLTQHHMDNCTHNPNITQEAIDKKLKVAKLRSESKKGSVNSDETRRKISKATKGMPKPQPVVECPHCKKSGGKQNMTRYHFDNCKFLDRNTLYYV